ncbi:MAG TPA: hypothetical protein VF121_02730, partial [Thermoanaerobaculia bacterium]|nr:hypothetical protein [Thermoanaerobaculia bacterium]
GRAPAPARRGGILGLAGPTTLGAAAGALGFGGLAGLLGGAGPEEEPAPPEEEEVSGFEEAAPEAAALAPPPPGEGEAPGEAGAAPEEEYDLEAARAEVETIAAELAEIPAAAEERIGTARQEAARAVSRRVEGLRRQAGTLTDATVERIGADFTARRGEINASFDVAHAQVDSQLSARRSEAELDGAEGRTRIEGVFSDHRTAIEGKVSEYVGLAESLRTREAERVRRESGASGRAARDAAFQIANGYASSERGRIQRVAARGVGREVSNEIRMRIPEGVAAVEEVTAPLPDEFQAGGDEALQGYDDGLPELLTHVDNQLVTTLEALDARATEAHRQLDTQSEETNLALNAAEETALARARDTGAQAVAQLDAGERQALHRLRQAVPPAVARIRGLVEEGIGILRAAETPDPESSRAFADQLRAFADGATEEASTALREGADQMAEEFPAAIPALRQGLRAMERETTTELTRTAATAESSLSGFVVQVDDGYGVVVGEMNTANTEMEIEVREGLAPVVTEMDGRFRATLDEAETDIRNQVGEGLAKNDEAVAATPGKAREAASDAAWDYDHPVLAALRDIGSIVAGIIVGILAVVLLVVAVILLIKVAIAALVVLGVSLVVAKIIVAVAAVALLVYGVYQAYQARVAAGSSGWAALGGAVLDLTGLTDIGRAFTDPSLSPFERGFHFGRGIATVATFFVGRGMNRRIDARLPASLTNPSRGAAWRALGRVT